MKHKYSTMTYYQTCANETSYILAPRWGRIYFITALVIILQEPFVKRLSVKRLIALNTNSAVFAIFWKIPRTIVIAGNIIMIMYCFAAFRKFYNGSNIIGGIYEAV